jgi:stage V sporulation protein B
VKSMQATKKFAFDIGITLIASLINMLLGFVITVLLGRYLGAEDLGLYNMASNLYGIAIVFVGIGIPVAIIKYVAEYQKERNKFNAYVSSGVITSLFLGVFVSLFFYFSSGIFEEIFHMPGLDNLLKIFSPIFPFALVGGALSGLLNGLREMKKYGMAIIFQSILMLLVSVPLIYWGFGVSGVVIGTVLSSAGSCVYLIWVTKDYFEITLEGYMQKTKEMLQFGVQVLGVNAINVINYQADIIMIGYFLTASDVGYYGVAVGFSKFFWIIPQAVQTITYPATSVYWNKKDQLALQVMIDKSMKYTACILLPIGLGVGFFAKDIITMIFRSGFQNAVLPMNILIIGTVIFGIVKAIGGSITGAGRPDIGLKIVIISAITNIVLNLTLIPYFGIAGAAIATTVSLSINALLTLILTIKILNVKFDFRWYAKMFGMTSLAVLLIVLLGFIGIYLAGIIILGIYMFFIIALFLKKEDRKYFKDLINY